MLLSRGVKHVEMIKVIKEDLDDDACLVKLLVFLYNP
jgi:hypothetical protein